MPFKIAIFLMLAVAALSVRTQMEIAQIPCKEKAVRLPGSLSRITTCILSTMNHSMYTKLCRMVPSKK